MAARPKNTPDLMAQVHAAVAKLREIHEPDLALAVETLASSTPGWTNRPPKDPNYPLWIEADVKARAQAKAKANGTTVSDVVREALEKFIAGEFTPTRPSRGGDKTSMTVRVPADLVERADQHGTSLPELGWEPTARLVAASYLRDVYVPAE